MTFDMTALSFFNIFSQDADDLLRNNVQSLEASSDYDDDEDDDDDDEDPDKWDDDDDLDYEDDDDD
ncbi:MAG: hypothetical protein Q4G03_11745, partial [Planctomycetia bacterium]|nr:hypothetical protein [Planctomycetia bacterium]